MLPVSWTPNARRAVVARIIFLLGKGNTRAAAGAAKAIDGGVKFLSENPLVGRKMDDMPPGYRRWFVRFGAGGYILLYRVYSDSIAILSVKHSLERDFPGILGIRAQAADDDGCAGGGTLNQPTT